MDPGKELFDIRFRYTSSNKAPAEVEVHQVLLTLGQQFCWAVRGISFFHPGMQRPNSCEPYIYEYEKGLHA